jgi:propionyl-CoA carboxylase alpha chain
LAIEAAAPQVLPGIPRGWRNVPSQRQQVAFETPTGRIDVAYRPSAIATDSGGQVSEIVHDVVEVGPAAVVLEIDGVRRRFAVAVYGRDVFVDSSLGPVHLVAVDRFPDPADQVAAGSLLAPMPGSVVRLAVAVGDAVTAGQPMLWLEAMKMQHQINAPTDGVVSELPVHEGQQVDVGAVLAVVSQEGES